MTEAPGATPTGGAAHSGWYGLYTMVQLLPSHLCSMGGCGDLQNGMNVVSGPALVYRNGTVNLVRVMSTVARYSVRSVTIVGATVAGGSISAVCRADVREPVGRLRRRSVRARREKRERHHCLPSTRSHSRSRSTRAQPQAFGVPLAPAT